MISKKYLAIFCVAASGVFFAGCGDADVTRSTVELKKDGKIVEYTIEDFSESYYDSDELASYIDSEVEAWKSENDGTVKVRKSKVEDQTAYLTIQYDSASTFSDFNGIECFSGSIVQAQSAGYDFDVDFVEASANAGEEDGSVETAEIQTLLTGAEVLGDDELKVLIIRDHVDVVVPGTIVYVSANYTEVDGDDTVLVHVPEDDVEQDVLIYVLYK